MKTLALLTSRQLEVAALIARGYSNKRIASELGISEHTVARHLAAIYERLDCGRVEVAVLVVESGREAA